MTQAEKQVQRIVIAAGTTKDAWSIADYPRPGLILTFLITPANNRIPSGSRSTWPRYRFSRNGRCVLLALTLTTQMYALYSFIGSKVASAKSQPPGNNRRFLKWKPNGPACISYHNGDVCRIMFSLDTQHATKAARRKVECHLRKECQGFFLSFVRLRVIFFCVLCAPDFLVVPPLR